MAHFNQKPGTKSSFRNLKKPFPDVNTFDAIVRSIALRNPFGCTSYFANRKNHPPVEKVREMYTAKFEYVNPVGKRTGTGQEMYDSLEGYDLGIAAVKTHMANIAAHRGKVRHLPEKDLYSVILTCHDPGGELYFLSLARDRITLSSYMSDEIKKKVEKWSDTVPALE